MLTAEHETQVYSLQHEIEALESLSEHLFVELNAAHLERRRMQEAKTWKGRYFHVLGHMLSLYCLYKLTFAAINIAFDRVGKIDPVTRGFQARSTV